MRYVRQKLNEFSNRVNNSKKKSATDPILLLIAELTAETNNNIKWLIRLAIIGVSAAISWLIALALRGL